MKCKSEPRHCKPRDHDGHKGEQIRRPRDRSDRGKGAGVPGEEEAGGEMRVAEGGSSRG